MTSIDDLARTIRDTHGIDTLDAVRESVTVLVDQIADDPDLYDPDANALTDAGVQVVTEAVAASYSIGAVATRAAQLLVEIETVVAKLNEVRRQRDGEIAELTRERDELIRAAMRTELRRADIAGAAGVKVARLHQIRHGSR